MIKAPTLFIYDLKTDKEIRKYPLKTEQYSSNSMFANAVSKVAKVKINYFYFKYLLEHTDLEKQTYFVSYFLVL